MLQQAAVSACFDVITAIPLVCGGANCTYPDFTSLGICSECEDVTANTKLQCGIVGGQTVVCNITTPAGIEMSAQWTSIGNLAGNKPTYDQFVTGGSSYDSLLHPNESCIQCGTPISADIFRLGVARFGDSGYDEPQDWEDTLETYDCTYSLCAQSFANWSTINGDTIDGTRSQSSLKVNPLKVEFFFDFSTLDTHFPGDQTFTIAYQDHMFIWQTLSSAYGIDDSTSGATSGSFADFIFTALYNSPDLLETMQNMAISMSNRMLVNPNATTVYGGVFGEQTFIRVQWWWFTPSVVLELIATLLLIVTILKTHKAGQYAWKSSLDPFIFGRNLLDTDKIGSGRDSFEMLELPT